MSIFSDILSAITTRGRRITIKMGLAKDFNDSKLKVGELGLVIDTDEVRIGLADGTTKELGGLDVADLPNASTTTKGVVQLNDSITSTSTTLGATANSVKKVADLANANKYTHPTSHPASMITGLATVATSGNYNDLLNKPSATVVGTAGTKDVGTTSGTIPIIGTNNKLDASIIPAIAITDVFVVNSQTAMLALVAQTGDVAVRTDLNKSFILKNDAASTLANWQELLTPSSPVQSVAGKIGAVTLVKGDVGLGNVDNTSDANKPVSTATQTALNNKVDKVTGKQLSTEDFTTVLKNKLEGLSTSGDYVLPTATSTVLGGVKVGTNINVTSGTISVANASTTTKGLVQLNDTLTSTSTSLGATARTVKELKDSINAITLSSLGGITIASIPDASATAKGLMTPTQVNKLTGIASGANFVQVTDSVTSTSATQAASANSVKQAYDLANSAKTLAEGGSGGDVKSDGTVSMSYLTIGSRKTGTTIGKNSFAQGVDIEASGDDSHAEGDSTSASYQASHAEGHFTRSSGFASHAEGSRTLASGLVSHAQGLNTKATTYAAHAQGCFNTNMTGSTANFSVNNVAFVIGKGTSEETRANAFRVKYDGSVYGLSAFNSTGADYAEYFEWLDSNPNNEDRVGYFVALNGEKIEFANSNSDYIIGVISANPSVIGDSYQDQWQGMYVTDEWGRIQNEYIDVEYEELDEEGNTITKTRQDYVHKLNPNYDNESEYTPREKRKEWSPVGMLGKLLVRDDGTCEVNGYAKVSDGGIATKSDNGYRVIKRVDENIVQIIFK